LTRAKDNTIVLSQSTEVTLYRGDVSTTEQSRMERIRAAALKTFAAHGTEAASLRVIAKAADTSVGLVQHHFGSKAGLIRAVDDYLLAVLGAALATPLPAPTTDPVAEVGRRVTTLIAEHPDVIDYLCRTLLDGTTTAAVIFDGLLAIGTARWDQLRQQQRARPDLDPTWAGLNPLILVLATLLLRTHIERHLPEPLTSPTQLHRWEHAVNALIRDGQLRD
jgi:AcrR family transcriptional regulator